MGSTGPGASGTEKPVAAAREVAGEQHHCKVVQLPINLAMLEALTDINQTLAGRRVTFLEAAAEPLEVSRSDMIPPFPGRPPRRAHQKTVEKAKE